MKNELKTLYSKVIKENNEKPYHFEKMDQSTIILKAYNPVCGDRFELYLDLAGTRINKVHFHGFGCAISKSSTSVLVKSIEGKEISEARDICRNFLGFITQELRSDELVLSDDCKAFSGVHEFPERLECASLSWTALIRFLQTKE